MRFSVLAVLGLAAAAYAQEILDNPASGLTPDTPATEVEAEAETVNTGSAELTPNTTATEDEAKTEIVDTSSPEPTTNTPATEEEEEPEASVGDGEAEVSVDEGETEVSVDEGETEVSVDEGETEVSVDESELYQGPIGFPLGIRKPDATRLPKFGPPADTKNGTDGLPIWHPPHKDVFIDGCDDDKADKWHWAHEGPNHAKPTIPHKWTTSTVTTTKTKTIFECPDTPCKPDHPKTKTVTTTVEVTTTICPTPIPTTPTPPPAAETSESPKTSKPGNFTKPAPTGISTHAPTSVAVVPETTKKPSVVTAGAAQNAAGALAIAAAVAAALI